MPTSNAPHSLTSEDSALLVGLARLYQKFLFGDNSSEVAISIEAKEAEFDRHFGKASKRWQGGALNVAQGFPYNVGFKEEKGGNAE